MDIELVNWIIARYGGADGTAMLFENSQELLNKQGLKVQTTTGLIETEFGIKQNYFNPNPNIISELNFKHSTTQNLFDNSFKSRKYIKEKWIYEHNKHKQTIKKNLEKIVQENNNTPIIIHNLISLREFHPQAAVALKEIIQKNKTTNFISYAADSSFEREERISQIQKYVIDEIRGTKGPNDELGPYNFENLYHIVLNKRQEKKFNKNYNIPLEKIFRLPDFLPFETKEPEIITTPDLSFLEFLANKTVEYDNGIKFKKQDIGDDPTFILCPVRPIERKKIKTSIYIASQYQKKKNKRTSVVVTHPNKDEGGNYFYECITLANELDVPLIYLGEELKLNSDIENELTLWKTYQKMSSYKTISMILSSKGGWENAINESIKYCIPTYVNPKLPSYNEILEMGINIYGQNLDSINNIVESNSPKNLQNFNINNINSILDWIDTYSSGNKRINLVKDCYLKGYDNLSSYARTPQFMDILKKSSS